MLSVGSGAKPMGGSRVGRGGAARGDQREVVFVGGVGVEAFVYTGSRLKGGV